MFLVGLLFLACVGATANNRELAQLDIAAGGTWFGVGTSRIRVLYPSVILQNKTESAIAWDDDNSRYYWEITPTNRQWTLSNGTYISTGGVCFFTNHTYAQAVYAFTAAVQTINDDDTYLGMLRDPATGPMYGGYSITVKHDGKIKSMTFAQVLNLGGLTFSPGHISGYIDLKDFDDDVPCEVWTLPANCFVPFVLPYEPFFYPGGHAPNGTINTPL